MHLPWPHQRSHLLQGGDVWGAFGSRQDVRFVGDAVATGGDCGHLYLWAADGELIRKLPADRCVVN